MDDNRKYEDLISSLKYFGKDPSRLIFEDELTGIQNRRFLLHYLDAKLSDEAHETQPLSLVMIDLDNFKQINDVHGHPAGDKALMHIAQLLKEVAGDDGLPVRYAGDEFMIVLPDKEKNSAMEVGERLLRRCREGSLRLDEGSIVVNLTLSAGVASVPEDALDSKGLIQKADAALYHSKRSGRNRVADAGGVGLLDAPQKIALNHLRSHCMVGRRGQLDAVNEAYEQFTQGHSQFLIVEGGPGMGKTRFLDNLRETFVEKDSRLVQAKGLIQEGFRPYFLATNILVALLRQYPDQGATALQALNSKQVSYLGKLLPQLEASQGTPVEEDESTKREGIFTTLLEVIPSLVEFRSLIILIDDLQFADAATLLVLRQLLLRQDMPVFVCGMALDSRVEQSDSQDRSLDQFYSQYQQELGIRKIALTPLTTPDIHHLFHDVFPQITLSEEFLQDLAGISQGNPLILCEILCKLIMDQKLTLVDEEWMLHPLGDGYLPRSLEEIVNQKISALDEEGRELLAQTSTLGEDVFLSVLTGSAKKNEVQIEDFIDRSVELGLLRTNFQDNDETVQFFGKRVLDIAYRSVQEDLRKRLHEQIGKYQEGLYHRRLLPSVSFLAHHFKRSANQEKARIYKEIQAASNLRTFKIEEAVSYSSGTDDLDTGVPLDPSSLRDVQSVIRCLLTAVRNMKFYPPESKAIANTNLQLRQAIQRVLARNEHLVLIRKEQTLFVNGKKLDTSEYKLLADKFLEFLGSVELGGMTFQTGLAEDELNEFLVAFGKIKSSATLDPGFWKRFSAEHHLNHIRLRQVEYAEQGTRKMRSAPLLLEKKGEIQRDAGYVPRILRCLLGTAKKIKLYPLHSDTITSSIEELLRVLGKFLDRTSSLTLAQAGDSLLINSEKVDAADSQRLFDGVLEFLQSVGLTSITFLKEISKREVQAFFRTLCRLPPTGGDRKFWEDFLREENISNILFNEYQYGVRLEQDPHTLGKSLAKEELAGQVEGAMLPELSQVLASGQVEAPVPERQSGALEELLERMGQELRSPHPKTRVAVLNACQSTLHDLPMALKPNLIRMVAVPLLLSCSEEVDQDILQRVGDMLYRMAESLVPFGDYSLASRICSVIHSRSQELDKNHDPRADGLTRVLQRRPEPKTQSLLVEDLKSGEPTRKEGAAQFLSSLGTNAIPLLIDMIRQVEDLRVRQICAGLLSDFGSEAGQALKQALVLEVTAQGRFRILEVIDVVTRSLETELAFALGDLNPAVRKAAFQLAERLNDENVGALLMNYARSEEPNVAIGAIKCLGKLKPNGSTECLVSLLNSTKEPGRAVACCQALGQIADSNSIESLARILARKGYFSFGKRWKTQVRAAAAFALKRIHPFQVTEVLRPLTRDADPRVRHIARAFVKG